MAKTKKRNKTAQVEPDSAYFLKLVLYLVIGAQWVRIERMPDWQLGLPVGLMIGLAFAMHDQFQIDRKIEYALLLVAAFVGYWLPLGLVIQV